MFRSIASFAALALLALAQTAAAQEPSMSETVSYTIGWITPPPQLYRITITTSARGEPLVFSLPRGVRAGTSCRTTRQRAERPRRG